MQLEAILVRCASPEDQRLLRRLGAIEQARVGQAHEGSITWRYSLARLSAAAAVRAGLIQLGTISEVADDQPVFTIFPPDPPRGPAAPTTPPKPARKRRVTPRREASPTPTIIPPPSFTPNPVPTPATDQGAAHVHAQAPSRNTTRRSTRTSVSVVPTPSVSAPSARPRRRVPRSGGDHAA